MANEVNFDNTLLPFTCLGRMSFRVFGKYGTDAAFTKTVVNLRVVVTIGGTTKMHEHLTATGGGPLKDWEVTFTNVPADENAVIVAELREGAGAGTLLDSESVSPMRIRDTCTATERVITDATTTTAKKRGTSPPPSPPPPPVRKYHRTVAAPYQEAAHPRVQRVMALVTKRSDSSLWSVVEGTLQGELAAAIIPIPPEDPEQYDWCFVFLDADNRIDERTLPRPVLP